MKDAGLTQVDAWMGTGGEPVAKRVLPLIHPKVYVPNHCTGLFNPFWPGMPYPFKDDALRTYLDTQTIPVLMQTQYFDKFVLTPGGVTRDANHAVKSALGFADVQRFSRALLDAVDEVASTSVGEDCGEGFAAPSSWARAVALREQHAVGDATRPRLQTSIFQQR